MEFEKIMSRMDELVSSVFDRTYLSHINDIQWKPAVDVYESKNYILVVVELAGISRDQVKVSVEANVLTISGVRTSTASRAKTYTCLHMEMLCGRFLRRVTITPPITGKTAASYESGLLKIKLFKNSRAENNKEKR